jgi:hypothetical protein
MSAPGQYWRDAGPRSWVHAGPRLTRTVDLLDSIQRFSAETTGTRQRGVSEAPTKLQRRATGATAMLQRRATHAAATLQRCNTEATRKRHRRGSEVAPALRASGAGAAMSGKGGFFCTHMRERKQNKSYIASRFATANAQLLPFVHDRSAPQSRRWRDHLDRHPHLRDEDRSAASHQKVRLVDPVSSLDYRRAYS